MASASAISSKCLQSAACSLIACTIYCWVQRYNPKIEKRLRRQWRSPQSASWRIDETYIKAGGRWAYLYRAVDKHNNTFFCLPSTHNAAKALSCQNAESPEAMATAACHQYGQGTKLWRAVAKLKKEGKLPTKIPHRQAKYLSTVVGAYHGRLKQLIC